MTPEAGRFEKARGLLGRAEIMLGVGLNEDAGRNAYLAGFHAAQAFIYDTAGRAHKSHNGVQTEFLRLTRDDPRFSSRSGRSAPSTPRGNSWFIAGLLGPAAGAEPDKGEDDGC